MRRLLLLFAVLCVVPLFGYDSPREYDGLMAEVGIEGTWQLIDLEFKAEKLPVDKESVRVFHDGMCRLKWNNEKYQGTYRTNPTGKPPPSRLHSLNW
jgi:hypothetical protein